MDTVDKQTRSRIMASVGQKNTGPEKLLRSALHKIGLRYRLHDRLLPGSPDLVFPKYNAAVFVHGCYWHRHGCYRSTTPKSRLDYWKPKFAANRERDERNFQSLRGQGWRVLIVWECAITGKASRPLEELALAVAAWLAGDGPLGEIGGEMAEVSGAI